MMTTRERGRARRRERSEVEWSEDDEGSDIRAADEDFVLKRSMLQWSHSDSPRRFQRQVPVLFTALNTIMIRGPFGLNLARRRKPKPSTNSVLSRVNAERVVV